MARSSASHSFIDVIDNALGLSASDEDIMRLNKRQIEDVAGLLLEFYDAWSPPEAFAGAIRVFIKQSSVPWIDWHPGMPVPLPPLMPLLYVDSVVIEDPVSGAVENMIRAPGFAHWTLVRRALACALVGFKYCRRLLADGSLVLAPWAHLVAAYDMQAGDVYAPLREVQTGYEQAWRTATALAEEEIRAVAGELFPEVLRLEQNRHYDLSWTDLGTAVTVASSVSIDRTGRTSYPAPFGSSWKLTDDVVRSICAATSVSASLLPSSLYEDATYRAILTSVASAALRPDAEAARVIPALASGQLPMFVGVPPKTLAELRSSEAAFDAWRSELRNAIRHVRQAPATPGFAIEAGRILDDALLPPMRELERVASAVGRVRAGTKSATVGFAIGAVSAAVRGGPGLSSALAAAGAGSAANLGIRALFPDGESGIRSVLLRLVPYHRATSLPK